jgi:hypothetical protein
MNRRSFIASLTAAAAGFALDPERLLWIPGAKTISIPKLQPYLYTVKMWLSDGSVAYWTSGLPIQIPGHLLNQDVSQFILTAVPPDSLLNVVDRGELGLANPERDERTIERAYPIDDPSMRG